MIFSINKGATLPILQMELINDGRADHGEFHKCIQNANIQFNMYEKETGRKVISCREAHITHKKDIYSPANDKYLIGYMFNERDTKNSGCFIGEFIIDFMDGGKLIVPIQDYLEIHIIDSYVKKYK